MSAESPERQIDPAKLALLDEALTLQGYGTDGTLESSELEEKLDGEFSELGANIWHLHHKQLQRSIIGRTACRLRGKQQIPLQYYADLDTGLSGWVAPDTMISTPPLFEQRVVFDGIATIAIGWAFAVRGNSPDSMVIRGNAPLAAFLLPHANPAIEVSVGRVASLVGDNYSRTEPVYTVFAGGNKSPTFIHNAFHSADDTYADLRHQLYQEPLSADLVERQQFAKQHAVEMAQQANQALRRSY